jgi:uncharacterized membrane protein
VEGFLDHHVLKLHNVIEYATDHDPGNYTFLGISLVMLALGWGLLYKHNEKGRWD